MAAPKDKIIDPVKAVGEEGTFRKRITHGDLLAIDENGITLLESPYSNLVLNIKDLVAHKHGTIYAGSAASGFDGVAGNGDIEDCIGAANGAKKFAGFLVATVGASLKLIGLDANGDAITAAKASKVAKGRVKTVGVTDGGVDFVNGQKIGYYTSSSDYFIATATVANGVVTGVTGIDCSASFHFEEALANQLQNLKPVHKPANKATIQVATRDGSNIPLTFTIVSGGVGYVVGEQLFMSDGTGDCIVSVATVNAAGAITGLTIVTAAEAMVLATNLTITGRTATDDTATLTVTALEEETGYIDLFIEHSFT